MIKKFYMSMMGELAYFLGHQIKQDDKGISICQEIYTRDLLKKYESTNSASVKTPMLPPNNLGTDLSGKRVNETLYRGMIGSLMYLTGAPTLGLRYPKCLRFDLKGYSNSNYDGCNIDRKSTSGACQLLGGKCCANILWMKSQLSDYEIHYKMTFCQSTGLNYNNGNYVAHPSNKEVKDELEKIATRDKLGYKTLLLKASFPVSWWILMTFVIQVLGGNHSSIEQFNSNTKGNLHLTVKGLPATRLDEGIRTSLPLLKGTPTGPKDSGRTIQLTDRGIPFTTSFDQSGSSINYQVDTTQSTRFKMSDPDQNKGKTSSKVEPDTEPPLLQTFGDYQTLLDDSKDDLKDLSDEEMCEAREEIDDEQPHTKEEHQPTEYHSP
ncbi:hypothetical protein Tco_0002171 [Tanacetum coccineum]